MKSEGLDWFAFTVKKENGGEVQHVEKFLQSHGDVVEYEGSGRWYRRRQVYQSGVSISTIPTCKNSLPVLVEIPGGAFVRYGDRIQKLAISVMPFVNVNRVDYRVDFFSTPGDVERVFWPEEFIGLKKQTIQPMKSENSECVQYTGIRSGKDEFVLRYYDKKTENDGEVPFEEIQEWWRLEWVVRKVLCKSQPWYRVTKIEDVRQIMVGCLYTRFKVPVNFVGGVDSLPRVRYHSDLPTRYRRLVERVNRDQVKIAEMEEQFGCGALKEF